MDLFLDENGDLFLGEDCDLPGCEGDECPGEEGCGGDNCFTDECPGGTEECPWEPPEGDCGNCEAGSTPQSHTISFAGIELDYMIAGAMRDFWENYFNSTSFEMIQEPGSGSSCRWRAIDNSLNNAYLTTTIASINVLLIVGAQYTVEIYGNTSDSSMGGTVGSIAFLFAFSADGADLNTGVERCDSSPATLDHWERSGAQEFVTIPPFDVTLSGFGTVECNA